MKNENEIIFDLVAQYWDALARFDYAWADFCDSCLERRGCSPVRF